MTPIARVALVSCVALSSIPSPAAEPRVLCPSAGKGSPDAALDDAVKAAYGSLPTRASDACLLPYKLLRYADADVLLTLTGDGPEATCHGCGGKLSAVVLERVPGGAKVVARFPEFGSYGTMGNPGRVDAIQFGADDAIAIEESGVFQGYGSTSLSLVVFRQGRLLAPSPGLPLDANDAGNAVEGKEMSVEGAWRIAGKAPTTIVIDYLITKAGKHSRHAGATWTLEDEKLVLRSGAVPPEYDKASGRE